MAVLLLGILIWALVSISDLGYENKDDFIFATMFFGVPFGVLLLDLFNLIRFDSCESKWRFLFKNFFLVFFAAFVIECMVVLIGFGIDRPQYKLIGTFGLGGAFASAILSLLTTGFYPTGKKKRKK